MSVIALPAGLSIKDFQWGVIDYSLMESSDSTGVSADRIISPSRWTASLTSNDEMSLSECARWEALILALRGDNVLAMYDIAIQAPRGTMRGSPVLAAPIAVGATSCQITATGTLLQSDNIQIGTGFGSSQLVKVAADVSSVSGTISISFNLPSRFDFAAGTAIVWDKPVAYMRRTNKQATLGVWTNQGTSKGAYMIELAERFG